MVFLLIAAVGLLFPFAFIVVAWSTYLLAIIMFLLIAAAVVLLFPFMFMVIAWSTFHIPVSE